MTGSWEPGTSFTVESADGTPIAVWPAGEGDGPALVLVHGAMSDHTTYGPLLAALGDGVATFALDRRGRGASGDGGRYAIEREFEDVAAVVDEVADRTRSPVVLWGHSFGADCAIGGASLSGDVRALVAYEPGLGEVPPAGAVDAVEAALAAGDREGAVLAVCRGVVGMTDEEIALLRASPLWELRLAVAPTVARELRAEGSWVYQPGCLDGVAATTVVLAGSESPSSQQTATRSAVDAIPGAELRVLEGHGHVAHQTDPGLVAGILREVLAQPPGAPGGTDRHSS